MTVIFENDGADKNLTNFEMTGDKKNLLVGEMGPLLGYLPSIKVAVDDKRREVKIDYNP